MSENKLYTLLPFLVFIFIFLGSGIFLNDFYIFPAPIAMGLGIVVAFMLFRKTSMHDKVQALIEGCGDSKIITMCMVYLLAGAFATITKATGGVDTMVNIGLSIIPIEYLAMGIFVIACFLSLSIGTSVGSIVALGPIVVALADKTGMSMGLLCGSLITGAMFGDNLSIISDTTITATQTMGVQMKDKFKANFQYAIISATLTLVILFFLKQPELESSITFSTEHNYWVILPYLLIIVLALIGIQVFVALFIGIIVAGCIGIAQGSFDFLGAVNYSYDGFTSMTEIFLLSMLTGGLARMVEKQGGIQWLLRIMQNRISGIRSAQFAIATLVSSITFCMANNVVSVLVAGNLSNDIASEYKLNRVQVASILDIFACIVQGILPYGAQVLILLSFTDGRLGYLDLFSHSYYLGILLIVTLIYMAFAKKRYAIA